MVTRYVGWVGAFAIHSTSGLRPRWSPVPIINPNFVCHPEEWRSWECFGRLPICHVGETETCHQGARNILDFVKNKWKTSHHLGPSPTKKGPSSQAATNFANQQRTRFTRRRSPVRLRCPPRVVVPVLSCVKQTGGNRSRPISVWSGIKPVQIQNLNLNLKNKKISKKF